MTQRNAPDPAHRAYVVDLYQWAHDRGYDKAAEEILFNARIETLRKLRGELLGRS